MSLNRRFLAVGIKHKTAGNKYNENFTVGRWGRREGFASTRTDATKKSPRAQSLSPRVLSRLTGGRAAALDRHG